MCWNLIGLFVNQKSANFIIIKNNFFFVEHTFQCIAIFHVQSSCPSGEQLYIAAKSTWPVPWISPRICLSRWQCLFGDRISEDLYHILSSSVRGGCRPSLSRIVGDGYFSHSKGMPGRIKHPFGPVIKKQVKYAQIISSLDCYDLFKYHGI